MKKHDYNDPYLEIYKHDLQKSLTDLINSILSPREKFVIIHYFFLDKTYKEIAKESSTTKERIGQLLHKALRRLARSNHIIAQEILCNYYPELLESKMERYLAPNEEPKKENKFLDLIKGLKRKQNKILSDKCRILKLHEEFLQNPISYSPSKLFKINKDDTPKMKFKKFLINYPHLKEKFDWIDDFSLAPLQIEFYVFMPDSENLLYIVRDVKTYQKEIYKYARAK